MDVKVKSLPVHQGPAGWNTILPSRQSGSPLDHDITCDWLVIGAGFAGLSAARRLSQMAPNDRIVVIDAGELAQSACGRNSGFMIDLPHALTNDDYGGALDHDQQDIRLNRAGMAFARSAAEEYAMAEWVFNPCGKTNAAASENGEKTNHSYAHHLKKLGEESEWLDEKAIRELTGTGFYNSGLYTPGTVQIQPASYIRSLAAGLRNRIVLYENTPALGWSQQRPDWLVKTPLGTISAPKIILATNGHAENFGFFKGQLMHVFTYASMTAPLSEEQSRTQSGQENWGVTPAHPFGATVRKITTPEGARIVVRSRFSLNQSMRVSGRAMAKVAKKHDAHLVHRFPSLAGIRIACRWAGHLCLSRNHVQAVKQIEEGIFSAVCQNGLGTARGTLAGLCAAELAADAPQAEARILSAMAEPQRLPPRPLSMIGANALMAYHEWRAGLE